ALAKMLAHRTRREHRTLIGDRFDDIDAKAKLGAERLELARRAGAAFAIGEIVADHDMRRAKSFTDHVGGERLGAQAGGLMGEIEDEGLVEFERFQQLELQRQRSQANERLVWGKELPRVRLEHHRARVLARRLCKLLCPPEYCLVAAMDAIEIADGKHCAF